MLDAARSSCVEPEQCNLLFTIIHLQGEAPPGNLMCHMTMIYKIRHQNWTKGGTIDQNGLSAFVP